MTTTHQYFTPRDIFRRLELQHFIRKKRKKYSWGTIFFSFWVLFSALNCVVWDLLISFWSDLWILFGYLGSLSWILSITLGCILVKKNVCGSLANWSTSSTTGPLSRMVVYCCCCVRCNLTCNLLSTMYYYICLWYKNVSYIRKFHPEVEQASILI